MMMIIYWTVTFYRHSFHLLYFHCFLAIFMTVAMAGLQEVSKTATAIAAS